MMSNETAARAEVARFERDASELAAAIARRIVGQTGVVDGVLTALFAGGHVLLEGAPGLGKTLLVRTLARALDLGFARVQFTPDLMPADIVGASILTDGPEGRRLRFQRGPVFTHVLLADEINRATPKTQSALLEAMQEHAVTIAGETHALDEPFFVLATQNPIEMEGTYPLPEAELDRFLLKLEVEPPSAEELHAILDRTVGDEEPTVEAVLGRERLLAMRKLVRQVPVARPVPDYVVRLVGAMHPTTTTLDEVRRWVRHGSSPRGAQALILAAKVRALRAGRSSPSFEDVRTAVRPALGHRILLGFEAEAEAVTTAQVLGRILERISPEA